MAKKAINKTCQRTQAQRSKSPPAHFWYTTIDPITENHLPICAKIVRITSQEVFSATTPAIRDRHTSWRRAPCTSRADIGSGSHVYVNTPAIELRATRVRVIRPATERQLRREAAVHHAGGRSEAIRGGIVRQLCGTLTSSIGILKGVSAPSWGPLIEVSLPPTLAVGGCTQEPPRVDGKAGRWAARRGRGPRDDRQPGGDPGLVIKHRRSVLSCQVYTRSNAVSSCAVWRRCPGIRENIGKSCWKVTKTSHFYVLSCVQPSPVFTSR